MCTAMELVALSLAPQVELGDGDKLLFDAKGDADGSLEDSLGLRYIDATGCDGAWECGAFKPNQTDQPNGEAVGGPCHAISREASRAGLAAGERADRTILVIVDRARLAAVVVTHHDDALARGAI